jgi:putative ABC transport system ATP-binding protein
VDPREFLGAVMTICSLHNASKTYGRDAAMVWALRNINLEFQTGEFAALSGPSGSGKTTALNLIGCLDKPTDGWVEVEGTNISGMSKSRLADLRGAKIGFIFQSFNLVPVLSALENVELALQLAGETKNRRERASALLMEVGLGDMLKRRPNQLSGGQQQRVAIARALVKEPALIIADEPTANLDSKTGRAILELMREMNKAKGTTFVFSTHDPMVMEFANRVVQLRDGEIESDVRKNSGEDL